MSALGQNALSLRCPYCLWHDMDIVLLQDERGYYCIKCSFTGSREDVEQCYAEFQHRYRLRGKRLDMLPYQAQQES